MTTSLSDEQIAGGGFYSVIPAPLLNDDRLSDAAVLLYALISQLTNANGECYASNAYLAKRRKCSERSITRIVAILESTGYINTAIETRNRQKVRIITMGGIDKIVYHRQNCPDVWTKLSTIINKEQINSSPIIPPLTEGDVKTEDIKTALLAEIIAVYPRVEKPLPAQRAVFSAANLLTKQGRFGTVQESLAYLMSRVRLYAASAAGQDIQFVPDACRWFSDGCYDADPKVWNRGAGETETEDIFAKRKRSDF